MIQRAGKGFTHLLINRHIIDESRADVYIYGIYLLVSTGIGMLSILVSSILFAKLFYGIVFLIFYVPLRIRAGGYHATTYTKCFFVSVASFIALLLSHLYFGKKVFFDELLCLCSIFAIVYIYIAAPVIHKNNLISIKKQKENRKIMKIILIIYLGLIILYSFSYKRIVALEICCLSIILIAFFVWFEKIRRGGKII